MIRHLHQYEADLLQISDRDRQKFIRNPISVGSARYYLQTSIESCINIANHIIATERLRAPKDYKDTFLVLNEAGILPDDFTQTMRELAGLRNLLVHLYWDVDDEMLYDGIRSELDDLETFVGFAVAYLDHPTATERN